MEGGWLSPIAAEAKMSNQRQATFLMPACVTAIAGYKQADAKIAETQCCLLFSP